MNKKFGGGGKGQGEPERKSLHPTIGSELVSLGTTLCEARSLGSQLPDLMQVPARRADTACRQTLARK